MASNSHAHPQSRAANGAGDWAPLNILVVTSFPTILTEFHARVASLPPSVKAQIANTDNESALIEQLRDTDIIFGEPVLVKDHLHLATRLRWVQLNMAGIDKALLSFADLATVPYTVTRAGGDSFGPMMGEWVIGHILSHERHFYQWYQAQAERRWKSDPTYSFRTLSRVTVGVMGATGSIGRQIAKDCKFFGMRTCGLASRQPSDPNPSEDFIDEWHVTDWSDQSGPASIPSTFFHDLDYLVNVLPSTAATKGMLDEGVLQHCRTSESRPAHTVFINLGRGDIISDESLLRALLGSGHQSLIKSAPSKLPVPNNDRYLSSAILDVFNTEPLPDDHPFYSLSPPLLTVSPHVSGMSGAAKKEIVDLFFENLDRFLHQREMLYEVDRTKGY